MQRKTTFRLLCIAAVFVLTGTAVLFYWTIFLPRQEVVVDTIPDLRVPRLIDGMRVLPDEANVRSIGILIDGMIDGAPTIGLAKASLVWEVPVEGGIPRFLAVYPLNALPETIGPVRSLRPYYLDFAAEVQALLLHVGGSPEALMRAKTFPLERLNQFYDHMYFWRTKDREAPHNVLTSQYLIQRALQDRSYEGTASFPAWTYTEEKTVGVGEGIRIVFSTPPYTVTWQWNGVRRQYERLRGEEPHRDADGQGIVAANVVTQFTMVEILDAIGRRRITTEGEGRALVATRGSIVEARWRKGEGGRTRFFDTATNTEIALTPGTTWIEVVPTKADVTILPPYDTLSVEETK